MLKYKKVGGRNFLHLFDILEVELSFMERSIWNPIGVTKMIKCEEIGYRWASMETKSSLKIQR